MRWQRIDSPQHPDTQTAGDGGEHGHDFSFTSMLMALQYIAARFARQDEFIDALHSLPAALAGLLPIYGPRIEEFAQRSFDDVAFLGQGALYPIASETALKVMESSSSYAQFFHTLEFRHGPMSIVSEKVLVGALLSRPAMRKRARYCWR